MNAKGPEENFWDDGSVLCQERGGYNYSVVEIKKKIGDSNFTTLKILCYK